jgi:hypothetical protein
MPRCSDSGSGSSCSEVRLHPEYFPAAEKGGLFLLESNVRIGRDGVFVAHRKVADLMPLIEQIAREDVTELRGPASYSPTHDALFGLMFGSAPFGGIGILLCRGLGGSPPVLGT